MKIYNPLYFMFFILTLFTMSAQGAAEKLPQPLQALQKQGLEFKGQFDAGPNLHGYVVQYQGQGSTVFLTPDKQHAIVGNLIDSSGNNLSEPQVEKYVYAPMGKQMWSRLESSRWITVGNEKAPRIVYAFFDPFCPYCAQFWEKARPWLDSGNVQLRVLLVGILRPESTPRAAAIMMAKDPSKALEDYENTHGKTSPSVPDTVNPDVASALKSNLQLMENLGSDATPAIYYLNPKGRLQQQQGVPPDDDTMNTIMGSKP